MMVNQISREGSCCQAHLHRIITARYNLGDCVMLFVVNHKFQQNVYGHLTRPLPRVAVR